MSGGKSRNTPERFWSQVNRNGPTVRPGLGPCWVWTGKVNQWGYGVLRFAGIKTRLAHRIAWFICYGKRPEQHVLHKCDNPPCCNPAHLFEGDQAANNADCKRKGRVARRPGEASPTHKLTDADVVRIRTGGEPIPLLAQELGVTVECVRHARKGFTWSHLC